VQKLLPRRVPMIAAGAGVMSVGAAVYARYRRSGGTGNDGTDGTEENEFQVVSSDTADDGEDAKGQPRTWKDSSGRTGGREGYVFGDISRGVCVKIFGKGVETDHAAELEGDAQNTQVQKLLREAIKVYRARGYAGTINLSHTVAYFNESTSCSIKAPDVAPWEAAKDPEAEGDTDSHDGSTDRMAEEGSSMAIVFTTLVSRLERRAKSWQAFNNMEGLDPNISQSAQIGFAIPVVKIGWGVSVTLTVSASTLLRWAEHVASLEARAASPTLTETSTSGEETKEGLEMSTVN